MKQRRSWDSQGNAIVEQQSDKGDFARRAREEDTAMRRLNASALSLADTRKSNGPAIAPPKPTPKPSGNPYASRGPAPAVGKGLRQRSSLDYLRALSEEIKKKRERGER